MRPFMRLRRGDCSERWKGSVATGAGPFERIASVTQPHRVLIWWWQRRIAKMRRCRTAEEIARRCGRPAHTVEEQGATIWHYPLRIVGSTVYGIHVTFQAGQRPQVYLHMEPANGT